MKIIEAKERMDKDKNDSFQNKTFSMINNTSIITNMNNFLSNRSIDNLINNREQINIKEITNSYEIPKNYQFTIKLKANRILPEGIQSGILLINLNGEIKFKPLTNNYKEKTFKILLSKIQGVINYRYIFKYKALNIFLEVYRYITGIAPNLEKHFSDVNYYCQQWTEGLISNYDYLMALNRLASRSFSDLSQYPIMPWVLKNYEGESKLLYNKGIDFSDERNFRDLSKPVGALNANKLERFKEKYLRMLSLSGEIPYLYGTFYSTPAHTVQFLVRNRPLYFLRMNNGSFEPCNGLFKSIKQQWLSIHNVGSDVKETIPE